MILKYKNTLYSLDNWKIIKLEDGYCVITFSNIIKYNDDYENYEINIKLVDKDYLYNFQIEHKDYDYNDVKQVKYRADNIIYNIITKEIIREMPYIDLDTLINVPKILKKANKQYEKEWQYDDNNTD